VALKEFFIEIDTRCNARCFYCDTGNKSRDPHRKSMDVGLFERVIDHALSTGLADQSTLINLFDRGEPTLHPDVSRIFRCLNERALRYCISSNCGRAVKLDADVSLALLDKFVISMPGFSQASYDRIHRLPIRKVLANIESMLADFRRRGFRGSAIMSLHTYRFNLDELAPAAEFCRKLDILFSPYDAAFADYRMARDFIKGTLAPEVLARAEQELFTEKIREQLTQSSPDYRCPQFDRVTIDEVGDLLLCCGAPRLGDAYDDGFRLGAFLKMGADEVIKLKTSASVCADCIASGLAYMGHNVTRPTEYMPKDAYQHHLVSVVCPVEESIIPNAQHQNLQAENLFVKRRDDSIALVEDDSHGYHRLLGQAWCSSDLLTITLLAKPDGRSALKLEMLADTRIAMRPRPSI